MTSGGAMANRGPERKPSVPGRVGPRRRRRTGPGKAAVVVIGAGLLSAGCTDGPPAGSPPPASLASPPGPSGVDAGGVLRSVRIATSKAGTARIHGTIARGEASGAVDGTFCDSPPAQRVTLPVFPGGTPVETEILVSGGRLFIRRIVMADAAARAAERDPATRVALRDPAERTWLARPAGLLRLIGGPASQGPVGTLLLLEVARARLERLGDVEVGGEHLAHWTARPERPLPLVGIDRAELWVDDLERLRRVRTESGTTRTEYEIEWTTGCDVPSPPIDDVATTALDDPRPPAAEVPFLEIASGEGGGIAWQLGHAGGTRDSQCLRLATKPPVLLDGDRTEVCVLPPTDASDPARSVEFPFFSRPGGAADILVAIAWRPLANVDFRLADGSPAETNVAKHDRGLTTVVRVGPAAPPTRVARFEFTDGTRVECTRRTSAEPAGTPGPGALAGDGAATGTWRCAPGRK